MSELRDRLAALLFPWLGPSAPDLVDMDFCPYVSERLGAIGATEWSRMLSSRPWTLALVVAQEPLVASLEEWERVLVLVCYRDRETAGAILRATDALPEVRVAPPPPEPTPGIEVVGGPLTQSNWWPLIGLGLIFGAAWVAK